MPHDDDSLFNYVDENIDYFIHTAFKIFTKFILSLLKNAFAEKIKINGSVSVLSVIIVVFVYGLFFKNNTPPIDNNNPIDRGIATNCPNLYKVGWLVESLNRETEVLNTTVKNMLTKHEKKKN